MNVVGRAVTFARNDPAAVFFHLGTATGLAGFCMSDPLPLRCCSITSSVASITFLMTRKPFGKLLRERQGVQLSQEEEDIYAAHFMASGMRPRQFKRLTKKAVTRHYPAGSILQEEGEFPSTIKLLTKGSVTVLKQNEEVFTVYAHEPICFLGDINLLEKADKAKGVKNKSVVHKFTATERVGDEPVTALEWDMEYFIKILNDTSETSTKLRAVLTRSVMQKVIDLGDINAKKKYIAMLSAVAADGIINALEKRLLADYANSHEITEEMHIEGLRAIGWTEEEYKIGVKKDMTEFTPGMWARVTRKLGHLTDYKYMKEKYLTTNKE